MKKYFSISIILMLSISSYAQDASDVLRYSLPSYSGTARFNSLSGAFGALGGDLSAVSNNPAGSVIFSNNQVGLTLNNSINKTNNNYFGTLTTDRYSNLDLNQAGAVFIFDNSNYESKGVNKFSLALNYENLNSFEGSLSTSGVNTNSIDKYFLSYANGVPLGVLNNYKFNELNYTEQQAYLGYNAYVIDPIPLSSDPGNYNNPNIKNYSSAVLPGTFSQNNDIITTGYNGKVVLNGALQVDERFSFGVNFNVHFTDYVKNSTFFEINNNNTSTDTYVRKIRFDNNLHTFGNGFSAQFGSIAKITKNLRLGISFDTPTWLSLTDELTQGLSATSFNTTNGDFSPDNVYPNTTMVYDPYIVKTPGKIALSGALVLGKVGFISVEYGVRNYSNMKLKSTSNILFDDINSSIKKTYTSAGDLRIGGELKAKQWSFRAGTRIEQSPYKNKLIMGDLKSYSGGIGYNFGGTKIDFAYWNTQRSFQQQQFSVGLTDSALIKSNKNNFSATISFEL